MEHSKYRWPSRRSRKIIHAVSLHCSLQKGNAIRIVPNILSAEQILYQQSKANSIYRTYFTALRQCIERILVDKPTGIIKMRIRLVPAGNLQATGELKSPI